MQAGQPELRVYEIPTDELVPYAGNAKEHPDWQVGQIAESIERFGFSDPVGVWHDPDGRPVIVEGHGRVMAAKELGRTCYMMELDPHYCDVIIARWEELTGGKAERVE